MNYPVAGVHYVVFGSVYNNNGSCRERFKPLPTDKNFCEHCTGCIGQSEASLTLGYSSIATQHDIHRFF
jgi:hypothetical protein